MNEKDNPNVAYGLTALGLEVFHGEFLDRVNDKDRQAIEAVQQKYGLPLGASFFIFEAVKRLRHNYKTPHYPYTASERAKALARLAECCENLNKALAVIYQTDEDNARLQSEFYEVVLARAEKTKGLYIESDLLRIIDKRKAKRPPFYGLHGSPLELLESAASVCEVAALTARESIPNYGKNGGKRTLIERETHVIEDLFFVVIPLGIKPTRGGTFDKFCKDVYTLAGFEKSHEAALRHFIKKRWPELEPLVIDGAFGRI